MRKVSIKCSMLIMIVVGLLNVGFASCSNDDEDGANVLTGKWIGDHSANSWTDFYFYSDGTGKMDIREGDVGYDRTFTYTILSQERVEDDYWGFIDKGSVRVVEKKGDEHEWDFRVEGGQYLTLGRYSLKKDN